MIGRAAISALLALAVAACGQADDAETAGTAPVTPAATATPVSTAPAPDLIASAESLAGEYRVAAVDGADINLPHGISASIAADRINVTSDCIRFAWSYRFESGVVTTERVPRPSCRRALLPEEEAIAAAFDNAGMVRRTPANAVEFSGGGRSVTMFGQ